jgi:hypothetical protein
VACFEYMAQQVAANCFANAKSASAAAPSSSLSSIEPSVSRAGRKHARWSILGTMRPLLISDT